MNILLTSVGRRSYLVEYFKQALATYGDSHGKVHAANSDPQNPSFRRADASVITPLIYSSDYVPFLLRYCAENDIQALISLFDADLPVLAANRARFAEVGTFVVVSSSHVIATCNDKWETYSFLKGNGFHVPATWLSLEDFEHDLLEGTAHFPVIIKPRWGMGSIGLFEACNIEEVRVGYQMIARCIGQTYLKDESSADITHAVLIQEKLNGKEYGLDVINDLQGSYRNTIVREKIAMRAGETDAARVLIGSTMTTQGEQLGRQISACLGHIGNLDMDVFEVDGTLYVLEMNARFGGGYPFSHCAGVDLPRALVGWLAKEPDDEELLRPKRGGVFLKDINLVALE